MVSCVVFDTQNKETSYYVNGEVSVKKDTHKNLCIIK